MTGSQGFVYYIFIIIITIYIIKFEFLENYVRTVQKLSQI